jgi:hypothetical protein
MRDARGWSAIGGSDANKGDARESEDERKKEGKDEAQVLREAPRGQQAEADSIVSGGGKKRMAEQGVQELRAATGTGTTSAGAASSSSSAPAAPMPQGQKRQADATIEELEAERVDQVLDIEDLVDAPMGDTAAPESGDPASSSSAAMGSLEVGALDAIATGAISEARPRCMLASRASSEMRTPRRRRT